LIWSGVVVQTFGSCDTKGKSSDLVLGFHSFGVDIIMAFCYAKNFDATKVPDFQSDIVLAAEVSMPIVTLRKYSGTLVKVMRYIPMWFGKKFGSPVTRAVFLLHAVSIRPKARVAIDTSPPKTLMDQIDEILRNPASLQNASHKIIYHSLLDPDANKGRPLPSRLSLWHEAQTLFGAGSDTTAIGATTISYHVLHNPEVQQRLVNELRTAWPVLEEVPRYEVLEKLPYLASPSNGGWFSSSPERPFADCGCQRGASHVSRRRSATACCPPGRSDDRWNFRSWRSKSLVMWPSRFR